ncbi:hypothetical protein RJT34_32301 [Clitoria ternatea]|uniref:Uncharacterized protein n=1 Tax=Clitoria ternatea TaxID=43366 RepID=A0AAN9EY20_CLITE
MLMWRLHQHVDGSRTRRTLFSTASLSYLNVLRVPLKAFTISHLADNTAHEHLQRTNIGISQINLALACSEGSQVHLIRKEGHPAPSLILEIFPCQMHQPANAANANK